MEFAYFYFEADYVKVLVLEDGFDGGHVDIRFLGCLYVVVKGPGFDLSFHSAVFLFHVPDARPEGAVLFFGLIDEALEGIVFVPYDVLCCFVAIEVDVRMENVMVGHDLFAQFIFVAHSLIELLLASLEGAVLTTQHQQRTVVKGSTFHPNFILKNTIDTENASTIKNSKQNCSIKSAQNIFIKDKHLFDEFVQFNRK